MFFIKHKSKLKAFGGKLTAMILSACLLFTPVFASASSYDSDIQNEQNKKDDLKTEINAVTGMLSDKQNQLSSTASELAKLESDRLAMMSESDIAISELNFLKQSIEESEANLLQMEQDFEDLEQRFVDRARIMYQHSEIDVLSLFFESDNIFDFIDKVNVYKKVLEEDTALLEQIKADKAQLVLKRDQQERLFKDKEVLIAEIESAIADLENQTTIAEDKYSNLKGLLSNLEAEEKRLNDSLTSVNNNIAALEEKKQEEQNRLEQEAANSRGDVNASSADFCWPVASSYGITSPFGYRTHPINGQWLLHTGVDLGSAGGTKIFAAQSGVVDICTTNGGSYGYYIRIDHGNGLKTLYAHCSALYVKQGQTVQRGQVIAAVGRTGAATGNHLHFEVILNGSYMQPLDYISKN